MIHFLKSLIFYPMIFLRGLFQMVFRFVLGLMLFSTIIMFIGKYGFDAENMSWHLPWTCLAFSFAVFMIGWFYDIILLKLNPDPETVLILD